MEIQSMLIIHHTLVLKHLFYVCFFLKKPCLAYIVGSLTLSLWPTALELLPERSLSNPRVLHKTHHSLGHVDALGLQHYALGPS